jgi:hypothetical protein
MLRSRMLWYILFFAIALKIPTVWLCWVVWWAIKAKPDHETGDASDGRGRPDIGDGDGGPSWWRPGGRADRPSRRDGPHGTPARRPVPPPTRPGVVHAEHSESVDTR